MTHQLRLAPVSSLFTLLLLVACGGDDTEIITDGGTDAPVDGAEGDVQHDAEGDVGETPNPFANLAWQVRCPQDGSGGCPADSLPEMLAGFDGEANNLVQCEVSDVGEGKSLAIAAMNENGNGLSLRITYPEGGGTPIGGDNTVSIQDGANRYAGSASSAAPSTEAPCQLGAIALSESDNGPSISGTVLCRSTVGVVAMNLKRDVTRAGSEPGAMDQPFPFTVSGCAGL